MRLQLLSPILEAATLLFASAAAAAPIITAGRSLTAETWSDISSGTWLIELYSPYCHHCQAFAPTWRDLYDSRSASSASKGFHFAQVDCAANGDLCHAEGVKFYPSIFLYVDGVLFDEYDGKREIKALEEYVDASMPGTVVWLDENGKREDPKKEVVKVEELGGIAGEVAKAEAKAIVLDLVEEETKQASSTAPGVAASSQTPPAATSTGVAIKLEPSRMAGPPPAFVKQIVDRVEEEKRDEIAGPRPDGKVHVLVGTDEIQAAKAGPAFIKFYAPWCGHCKALAPAWTELASQLADDVHVYQVDCESGKNKKACKTERVSSYPTLLFFNEGNSAEFTGKRDVASMKAFALKAASATKSRSVANEYELKNAVNGEDEVIFLFLHLSDISSDDLALTSTASKSLIGGAPFYTSTSPDLFTLFSLPSTPTILVFKDRSLTPSSSFPLPPSSQTKRLRLERTLHWLRSAKLATLSELSSQTYNDLMPTTGSPPLVGLAVLSRSSMGEGFEEAKKEVERLARGWGGRKGEGREVVWAWVDGDKWAGWAKGMYGVKGGKEVVWVVADPKALDYWKVDRKGEPLKAQGVYELIEEGIYTGAVRAESSRNFVERVGAMLENSGAVAKDTAEKHPFLALLAVAASGFLMWRVAKWLTGPIGGSPGGTYAKLE